MKKKTIIIIASIAVVFALGLLASIMYLDWPVDRNNSDGDIAKSSHFLRKSAEEKVDNMQELLQNDEAYRSNFMAANLVMQTRAAQFSALLDMSNEVAGDIPEFADVLGDMNAVRPMVDNVCALLGDLHNTLDGNISDENLQDLTQGSLNASLAYVKLQEQNSLADRFIATTDDYLKKAQGSDRLLFVRDGWVDYQRMTAALNGDEKSAQELQEKGALLSSENTLAALKSFDASCQEAVVNGSRISNELTVKNHLAEVIPADDLLGLAYLLPVDVHSTFRYSGEECAEVGNLIQESAELGEQLHYPVFR